MDPIQQARAALFLNSELAEMITGTVLPVDAGLSVLDHYNHDPVIDE
jgi:enoyl-[acyl-carrier-protein] reductase (NADH)